ncbi:MAG: class I SAM-dependent methyltransferase [Nitrospirota bacterium]|nr:class I SAM-dependent methyltransferase [Nitrospirota bacterium]
MPAPDYLSSTEAPKPDSDLWHRFYQEKQNRGRYPTEWVIRTLAGGNYPKLKIDKSKFAGARILDLSCGDGRNLPLLLDLGFEVHATEIAEPMIRELKKFALDRNWDVSFQVGRNTQLPYLDGYFDYVLSCSSFYYIDMSTAWEEVMREIARIVRPGGIFIANFPDPENAVLAHAEELPDGSMMIRDDPFKLRNGLRFMVARTTEDVARLIGPWFTPLGVGRQNDNFYGLMVSAYFFAAQRA